MTRATAGKMQTKTSKPRADAPLKRIWMDICFGRNSELIYLLLLDDNSSKLFAKRMKCKSDTLQIFHEAKR